MLQAESPEQILVKPLPEQRQEEPIKTVRARKDWWVYVLLTLGLVIMVVPFIWMVLSSLKGQAELAQLPPTWIPKAPTLSNYSKLFTELNFPRYFMNSVILAVSITILNLLFCSMIGYALAKLKFVGKNALFILVLATLMIPSAVTLVPLFVLMSKLQLVNTLIAVILPESAAAFGVFLMRQFMLEIPDELLDAARVDGANEFFIFWRIVLPLTTPALATLAILTFLASWNDFLWPLIVLTNDQQYNLPVAIATFAVGEHGTDYGLLLAGAVLVVTPMIIIFLLLQRFFTQGIAMTGLKG
jgi:multiple sugar transport system permease protein